MNISFSCRIVVKFREAGASAAAWLQDTLYQFPGSTGTPLFISVHQDTIVQWVHKARQANPGYHAPDFSAYYGISCTDAAMARALVEQLCAHDAVALAYTEQGFAQAPAVPGGPPPAGQGYLWPAPLGIGAYDARLLPGGDGAGMRFIDIEQGWLPHHEAVELNTLSCTGLNDPRSAEHGTAVLGLLSMPEQSNGLRGITPGARGYVVSQWRPGGIFNTADAVMAAIAHLRHGDVLLLEAQTFHADTHARTWPVEIHEACCQAIRLATALGIVVIEPAGNGSADAPAGNDLDEFLLQGVPVLNPLSEHYLDSGAIMVAGATATVPHIRLGWSNYGRRVDCYAWGEGVATASSYPRSSGMAINTYTGAFGGTSAAAAIIAGAALLLQGIAEAHYGFRLSPQQLRRLLGHDHYGTASAGGREQDRIGVMPNLHNIITHALPAMLPPGRLIKTF